MKPNGAHKPDRPDLSSMGAPDWFIAAYNHLDDRVSHLEQGYIRNATKAGASAGRRWGTLVGSFLIALSTMLAQCDAAPNLPTDLPGYTP